MHKTASKNIIPSGSYEFFKSGSQLLYACKLQITISQNNFRNFFLRKPYKLEVSNLVFMFHL